MPFSSLQSKYVIRRDIEHEAGRPERLHVFSRIGGSWDCQIFCGVGMLECFGWVLKADEAGLWHLMLWEHPMSANLPFS